jgi:hypothetical protein
MRPERPYTKAGLGEFFKPLRIEITERLVVFGIAALFFSG